MKQWSLESAALRRLKMFVMGLALGLFPAADIDAQSNRKDHSGKNKALTRAEAAFGEQNWQRAAELYARAVEDTSPGDVWFRFGFAHFRLGNDRRALDAYREAEQRGVATPRLLGTAAVAAQRLGDGEEAWAYLRRAADAGLSPAVLQSNASFAPFRSDRRFGALIERARQVTFPCLGHDPSRQFDFWVGEWKVLAGGQQVGTNRISSLHEGCLIVEDYTTVPGGFSGKSVNFYDPGIDAWRQIWIDSAGQVTRYRGRFEDGAMRFEGDGADRAGSRSTVRMTFTPNDDGSVRQLIERRGDDGTWSVSFDGRYELRRGD